MLLQNLVKNKRRSKEIRSNYTLYLFGSYYNDPKKANDIDLLIVYDKRVLSIEDVLDERRTLRSLIKQDIGLLVDICILNQTEYEDDEMMKYIKKIELG
jgi:predicted nucleotidyltransferase